MNAIRLSLAALLASALCAAAADDGLVLRGSGPRTKPILGTMYELSLHVPAALAKADAKTIIESDQPMTLTLALKSRLITRERFVETTTGGFAKAAESGYKSDKTQAFLDLFGATEFKKGDTVVMRYGAGGLETLYRTGADNAETPLGTIRDAALKQALFAIWLGDKPAQDSLKKALLGP
jgi:hypothetical protein